MILLLITEGLSLSPEEVEYLDNLAIKLGKTNGF
jgi:hypothetical protein